jgi:hypothetical protein
MSSVEVNMQQIQVADDNDRTVTVASQRILSGTDKRRFSPVVVGSFLMGTFVVGLLIGVFINGLPKNGFNGQCSLNDDLETELGIGVDTIAEWFPESAKKLQANRDGIINHMVNFEDPEDDSAMGKVLAEISETSLKVPDNMGGMATTRRLLADKCVKALSGFVGALLRFVAGFVKIAVPPADALREKTLNFCQAILTKLQVHALVEKVYAFASAPDAKALVKAFADLLGMTWKQGGSWMKLLIHWIADKAAKPWDAVKQIVRLVASMAVAKRKGTAAGKAGQLTLQLMAADGLKSAAAKVGKACNITVGQKKVAGQ